MTVLPFTFVAGWFLVAVSAGLMIRANLLDRRMQAFRRPNAPESAYTFVPVRWQPDLYVGAGPGLVKQAWRSLYLGLALGLLGMVLVAVGMV